jgi:hypothetical protein
VDVSPQFFTAYFLFSKEPNKVGISLSSHEKRNRYSFHTVLLYSYFEFQMMDEVQKPSDSE